MNLCCRFPYIRYKYSQAESYPRKRLPAQMSVTLHFGAWANPLFHYKAEIHRNSKVQNEMKMFLLLLALAKATICNRGTTGLLSVINNQSKPTNCERRVLVRVCKKHASKINNYPKLANYCAENRQQKLKSRLVNQFTCSSIIECGLLLRSFRQ